MDQSSVRSSEIVRAAIAAGGVRGGVDGDSVDSDSSSDEVAPGEIIAAVDGEAAEQAAKSDAVKPKTRPEGRVLKFAKTSKTEDEERLVPGAESKDEGAEGELRSTTDLLAELDAELTKLERGEKPAEIEIPEGLDPKIANTLRAVTGKLSGELATSRSEAQAWQQRAQQVEQWAAQQMGTLQKQLQQMEVAQARLQAGFETRAKPLSQDPVDRIRDEWLQQAMGNFKPELETRDKQIAELRATIDNQNREARNAQFTTRFQSEARAAADEIVLAGFAPEEREMLAPGAAAHTLSVAAHLNTSLPEAAKIVHAWGLRYARGIVRARSTAAAKHLAEARGDAAPGPTSRGKSQQSGEEQMPTYEALTADGRFNDHMEWMAAGSPALRRGA